MLHIVRVAPGSVIHHVLNRGNARRTIFQKDDDARAFLDLLHETKEPLPMRILGYCIMGNHWHTVLWPYHDGDLSRFMARLTTTHVGRVRCNLQVGYDESVDNLLRFTMGSALGSQRKGHS